MTVNDICSESDNDSDICSDSDNDSDYKRTGQTDFFGVTSVLKLEAHLTGIPYSTMRNKTSERRSCQKKKRVMLERVRN